MKKIKILYLFRRPVKKNLKMAEKGLIPQDYFFGFTTINNKVFEKRVSDRIHENKILWATELLFIKAIYPFTRVGFSIFSVLRHLGDVQNADVVFATADTYGLPLGLLKWVKLVKKPVVLYTGGVCDAIIESQSFIYRFFVRTALKNIDQVITNLENESKLLSETLNLPRNIFKFVPYGIDTDYFKAGRNQKRDFVLAIGADVKRDWVFYKKIAKILPNFRFKIITMPNLIKFKMPQNVEILYNLPIGQVRDYMRQALCILILSKKNYRFAGQSTIFRAMACSKAVIFNDTPGVDGYNLKNFRECIIIDSSNLDRIKLILGNRKLLLSLGPNARKFIQKNLNYKIYSKNLENIFKNAYTKNLT